MLVGNPHWLMVRTNWNNKHLLSPITDHAVSLPQPTVRAAQNNMELSTPITRYLVYLRRSMVRAVQNKIALKIKTVIKQSNQ
jgi:hypothetical protein